MVCNQRDHPQWLQEGDRVITVSRDPGTPGRSIAMNVNGLVTVHMTVKEAKQLAKDLNAAVKDTTHNGYKKVIE